jgi:hypothetical protein
MSTFELDKSTPSRQDVLLRSALSEDGRSIRKAMLIVSVIGALFAWTNALPQKVEAYGIEFPQLDPRVLYIVALVGLLYLMSMFALRATLDLVKWRMEYWSAGPGDNPETAGYPIVFAAAMIVADIMIPMSVSIGATSLLVHYLP